MPMLPLIPLLHELEKDCEANGPKKVAGNREVWKQEKGETEEAKLFYNRGRRKKTEYKEQRVRGNDK